jgi:hypothetical protein
MLDGAKEQDVERKERHDITKATATATVTATPSSLTPAVPDASIDGDESKKLFKTKNEEILLRQTSRLQMEIYDTIIALRQNDIAWNNLNGIKKYLYCLSESSVLLVYVTVILICMSPSCPKYIHTHKHTHTNTHAHTHSLALSLSLSLSLMSLTLPPPPLHYTTPPYRRTAPWSDDSRESLLQDLEPLLLILIEYGQRSDPRTWIPTQPACHIITIPCIVSAIMCEVWGSDYECSSLSHAL